MAASRQDSQLVSLPMVEHFSEQQIDAVIYAIKEVTNK